MERWNREAREKKKMGRIGFYLVELADELREGSLSRGDISPLLDILAEEIESLKKTYSESSPPGTSTLRTTFQEVLDLYLQSMEKVRYYLLSSETEMLNESKILAERAIELTEIIQTLIKDNEDLLKDDK